jgi:Protein of unknown function (DUF3320)
MHAPRPPYTPYELGSVEAREPLRTYLIGLLRHEAPIHRELVNKRIRAAFDIGRIGSAIRDNIDFVANRSHVDGNHIYVDAQGFYRLDKVAATAVRIPGDEENIRAVQHVPTDELDLAVIGSQVTCSAVAHRAGRSTMRDRTSGPGEHQANVVVRGPRVRG